MRFSSLVQLGSLPLVALLAGLGAVSISAVGCDFSDGHDGDYNGPQQGLQQPSADPEQVAIDTGATLKASPGGGVGVFVEYTAGGHWQIVTQCDTATSGLSCGFDVFVIGAPAAASASGAASTDAGTTTTLSNPQGQDLAGFDQVSMASDGSLHLSTETGGTNGGLTFDATAGAAIELEMYLDGNIQPDFIYWMGDKVLHTGAPTDPIDFAPTAP